MVELANGCICCTVADDFLPAIEAILARPEPPDHILIETSGLALPKPLVKAFSWPEVRARVTVDGVVTVADASAIAEGRFADDEAAVQAQREADPALDHENPLEEVFEDQLQCADMVVLNKTDLLDAAAADAAAAHIARSLRPGVRVVRARNAAVEPAVLLGLDAEAEGDLDTRPSHHDGAADDHDHDDFESFTVPLGPVADADALEAGLIAAIEAHDVLRVKGFLDRPDRPRREVVQGVGPRLQRYFDRPWRTDEVRRGEIVVIGRTGLDRAAITRALQALAPPRAGSAEAAE